ncbi:ribbon-helix-helix protein, CopG family [Haladaptatus sp. ZSTT2]|uniref:ribbon-helix-helix protein, CopG family n=1 Tax=Haladaptatus sp. ZSTT2 TaxID=3120515 RepID=UPI00300EACCA
MGNKNKTISFRVNEDAFETLREIAEERDISLSAVFRDYVQTLVAHDGQVRVVPEHELVDKTSDKTTFPPRVEVPKSLIHDHERLELENKHLRDQLDDYKQYITQLHQKIDELNQEDDEEVILLDDLDDDLDHDHGETFRLS